MTVSTADPRQRPASAPELLRFSTAGSVDDGKSTLIGRLLHDSKGIFEDQLVALERASQRRGGDGIDLALLTDGLRAEREQGITIDVAYRYFATPRRRFIIADTPGHLEYTRNMATGASTADLAVVLVDARAGILEQTRRHMIIAGLLRVPHVVAAINKMDLVGYDEAVFRGIATEVAALAAKLGLPEVTVIPISALCGDNIVRRSAATPWYDGPAFLEHLETVELTSGHDLVHRRFPVQWVIRGAADTGPDYRAYAGRIEGGIFRPGDEILALPSGIATTIRSIDTYDGPLRAAFPPQSVAIRLASDVELGRGALLTGLDDGPPARRELDATACWLGDTPVRASARYWLMHTTRTVRAVVDEVIERLDIDTLDPDPGAGSLGPNDVGRVRLRLVEPIFADPYQVNRATGSAILVDEATNATVGALLFGDEGS
ncbi:MAG TPA: GTP-binding protein [Candidatus Limnocylindrales bacterium]|jgi:bifunctional enzyme CysN/CysC|nr:GTP-binding protein [Candidatus Limnocylindrales bacterium]